jgi:DNA repair protein RecN (Recombination protein N)
MLRFLGIEHLAVIDALELELQPGLNVLTGETGAGKSILVEAVGLLLGGRASPDLIRTGEETATIQALFEQPGGDELIVRREITQQGRSRAFVNGSLVTAAALKELGNRLVDLHGQHEHQALLDPDTHLDLLDRYAGLDGDREQVATAFAGRQEIVDALAEVRRREQDVSARADLLRFQLAEIERAALKPGEDEELCVTRQILSSADKVQRLCAESYASLYESDEAVLAGLGHVWRRVADLAAIEPRFAAYLAARDGIKSQLEDLATFLRSYAAGIDASPARLQEVEDRLALLERLKRKYGPALADVIARAGGIRNDLASLDETGVRVAELERQSSDATAGYLAAATSLSAARQHAAPRFARAFEAQLADLAMERTRFEVRFESPEAAGEGSWGARGIDRAEFYVSPNPGEDLRPLARIVSGGELSRMMLGLKTLASTDTPGKTLIFDEVDAGIGGRVADAVGSKLRALGNGFQVLCITHLPQIAAYGGTHFQIVKTVKRQRTLTEVERLAGETRVEELARMIGGARVTEHTRASAREMLCARSVSK